MAIGRYQMHEHSYVRGPRSNNTGTRNFSHSHEGGDVPHEHEDTGPSCYTIDKDDWYRRTGLRGGGRKKYTVKPNGEQLALVAIDPADLEFDVVYCVDAMAKFREWDPKSTGGGDGAAARMELAFGMKANLVVVK